MKNKKTFVEHLEELRRRIIIYASFFVIACLLSFAFSKHLLAYVLKIIGKTVFLSPAEGFLVHVKISVFAGFMISLPVFFYQAWAFISGALEKKELKSTKFFCLFSFFLFLSGAVFAYFIILPLAVRFLLSYQRPMMRAQISVSQYFDFMCGLLISFGFVFELPLVIVFLTKLNIIGPGLLAQKRKYAVLLIFIAAAVLTPPDVITQFLMAVPLLLLYETGIILSRFFVKKRK